MAAPRLSLPEPAQLQAFARLAAPLLLARQPRAQGQRASGRRAGNGLQHLDHRPYQMGDPLRHIDWRASARWGVPLLRRFEAESSGDWCLLLDASASMAVGAKWQLALQAACALAYAVLQLGHRVALARVGEHLQPLLPLGRGAPHYARLARCLRDLRAPDAPALHWAAAQPWLAPAANTVLLSDFLAEDAGLAALQALLPRSRSLHALQLRDPQAECLDLPLDQDLELVDAEDATRLPVRLDAAARSAAAARREQLSERLRGHCARQGVAFSDWTPGASWSQQWLRHLARARC